MLTIDRDMKRKKKKRINKTGKREIDETSIALFGNKIRIVGENSKGFNFDTA